MTQIIPGTHSSLWGFDVAGRQAGPGSRAGKAGSGSRRKPFRGGAQVRSLKIQFRKVNATGSSPGSQEKTVCRGDEQK